MTTVGQAEKGKSFHLRWRREYSGSTHQSGQGRVVPAPRAANPSCVRSGITLSRLLIRARTILALEGVQIPLFLPDPPLDVAVAHPGPRSRCATRSGHETSAYCAMKSAAVITTPSNDQGSAPPSPARTPYRRRAKPRLDAQSGPIAIVVRVGQQVAHVRSPD